MRVPHQTKEVIDDHSENRYLLPSPEIRIVVFLAGKTARSRRRFKNEYRSDPGDHFDYLAAGHGSQVASQQKLGLWTKLRTGSGFGDHSDSSLVGAHLDRP